jgi:hypothetical protein
MLLVQLSGNAQPLPLEYYTVNEGLVSNSIRRIFQDSQGHLWIATLDGLSKYDGHRFTNYTRANGMPWDLVNDMLETNEGQLIFACNDGHLVWIDKNRIVKTDKPGPVINRFLKMPSGTVLVATDRKGIQEWQEGRLLKPAQPFPEDNYYSINVVNDSTLLAGSDGSVQLLTWNLDLIHRYDLPPNPGAENRAYCDKRGRLWTSQSPGFTQLGEGKIIPLPASLRIAPLSAEANIRQIYEDKDGNIWVAGSLGLVQIAPDNAIKVYGKKQGLLSDQVNWIFQDRESNLWIGTSQGLCKLVAKRQDRYFDNHTSNSSMLFATNELGLINVTPANWLQFDRQNSAWRTMIEKERKGFVVYKNIPGHPPLITKGGEMLSINTSAGKGLQKFLEKSEQFLYHVPMVITL